MVTMIRAVLVRRDAGQLEADVEGRVGPGAELDQLVDVLSEPASSAAWTS